MSKKGKTTSRPWLRGAVLFLAGQAVTLLGSSIVQFAVVWHVTMTTSSGMWVTALTLCSFLPQMLVSLFAGVWADRYNRKCLIMLADAVIAAATLVLALWLMSGGAASGALGPIILISAIRSVGTGVQTPTVAAMLPQLVPEDQLMRVNGINGSIQSVVQFASPAAAGALLAAGPIHNLLLIDVVTAGIGIGLLALVQVKRHTVSPGGAESGFFGELAGGVKYAAGNRFVGRLLVTFGTFIFLCVPSGFLATLMIQRTFGDSYLYLTVNEMAGFAGRVFGLLNAIYTGFMPLGMAVFGPLADVVRIQTMVIVCAVVILLFGVSIPLSVGFYRQGLAAAPPAAEQAN